MLKALRQIRQAVKFQLKVSSPKKPKHLSVFLAAVGLYHDCIGENIIPNFDEIAQIAFRSVLNEEKEVEISISSHDCIVADNVEDDAKRIEPYLLEFFEKTVNRRSEIGEKAYHNNLIETSNHLKRILLNIPRYSQQELDKHNEPTSNNFQSTQFDIQKSFLASTEFFYVDTKDTISIYMPIKNHDDNIASIIEDAEAILNDYENIVSATGRCELVDISEDYHYFGLAADYIRDYMYISGAGFVAKDKAIRKSTANAAKVKYAPLNEWKEEAREMCRQEWRSGSNSLHNKMVQKYMRLERFKLTPDGEWPKEILLRTLAEVADEPEFKGRNLKYGTINKK